MIKIKSTNVANMQLLLFIAAIILFYLLLKPLLIIFLASIILTYIFYPVHTRIRKLLKHENLSILITLVLIILIFLLPFVFVASQIPKQTSSIYNYAKENIVGKGFFDISCENVNSVKCNTVNFVSGSGYFDFDEIVDSIFKKITEFATYLGDPNYNYRLTCRDSLIE